MKKLMFITVAVATFALANCASAKKQVAPASAVKAEAPHASAAPAQAAAAPEPGKAACTKGSETRQLEVVKNGEGCQLNYTKGGKTSSVASSSHGTKHCLSSEDKIRKKLEKSGYSCS